MTTPEQRRRNDARLWLLGVDRDRVGRRAWRAEIGLPDDDTTLVTAGMGSSNLPGEPTSRVVVRADSAEDFEMLAGLLMAAAASVRKEGGLGLA